MQLIIALDTEENPSFRLILNFGLPNHLEIRNLIWINGINSYFKIWKPISSKKNLRYKS